MSSNLFCFFRKKLHVEGFLCILLLELKSEVKIMNIGKNIKTRRATLGLTLEEVAKIVGVSRQTIQRYESGVIASIPSDRIEKLAQALSTTPAFIMFGNKVAPPHKAGVRIPVLGRVAAGIPIEAIEDVEDWEEIPESMAKNGEYFALKIKGKSMEPRIIEGDVVIVKKQSYINSGDVAIVLVNGDDATIKQVTKSETGITLIGWNPLVFPPQVYSNDQIKNLPIQILGKVVEIRGKL